MINSLSLVKNPKLHFSHKKRAASPAVVRQQPADTVAVAEASAAVSGPSVLKNFVTGLLKGNRWKEFQRIKRFQKEADTLQSPAQFQAKTEQFKERLAKGESLDSIRAEAYAVAVRAAQVATGLRPYDCQVLGAISLGSNEIAEMMTGEGKTLTAVLPLYLHALAGKGAHLITVNDTLAQRDARDMAPVFKTLGLSVGTVLEGMTPEEKRAGYNCDVTYTTDRSIGFDYLRDRTAKSARDKVQREPFYALVDEVDEVLLDEARTPLIISGPAEPASPEYYQFDKIVKQLKPGIDYFVDREDGTAWPTELGLKYVENELWGESVSRKDPDTLAEYHRRAGAIRAEGKAYRALLEHQKEKPGFIHGLFHHEWSNKEHSLERDYAQATARTETFGDHYNLYSPEHQEDVRYLNAALKANALFEEGVDYIVQDQSVKIVDENKGRTSKGRRYNQGLHQALEAKSGVPVRPESKPIASITYPNLFKHYPHLAGMSGTAKSAEQEFQKLYNLSVTAVPTNLQFKTNPQDPDKAPRHNRIDQPDSLFATKREKFQAVVEEAVKAYREGVPVLLGTLSVEANEYLHAQLVKSGVNPASIQVLNADNVRGDKSLENAIIAQAGRSGMITVATNMAGRGVNIKPDFVNYKKMALTIESLSAQSDKPIVVEVKDEKEKGKLEAWLGDKFPRATVRVSSDCPVTAGATLLKSSDFPTGGLYVIGTERSKSRRIDDQLIGRAGRQGKPGKSKFFLSAEDDLVRELAKQKIDGSLEYLSQTGAEGEFIDKMVRKAQGRLSEMDLHAREQTGLYDETLNVQRETYYQIRDGILDPGTDLRYKLVEDGTGYLRQKLTAAVEEKKQYSAQEAAAILASVSSRLQVPLTWTAPRAAGAREIVEAGVAQLKEALNNAMTEFDRSPVKLDDVYRQALLDCYDRGWSDHLEQMEHLRTGVQWVTTLGEKPEDAYKRRGFEAFDSMLDVSRDRSVEENVPQIIIGASILKRERELQSDPHRKVPTRP